MNAFRTKTIRHDEDVLARLTQGKNDHEIAIELFGDDKYHDRVRRARLRLIALGRWQEQRYRRTTQPTIYDRHVVKSALAELVRDAERCNQLEAENTKLRNENESLRKQLEALSNSDRQKRDAKIRVRLAVQQGEVNIRSAELPTES